MSVLVRLGGPVLGVLAQVLSIPVYYAYAWAVRGVNLGRPRHGIDNDVAALMAPHFPELDLSTVQIIHPAVIPSARRSTRGLTLGHTILLRIPPDPDDLGAMRLLLHELVHVRQNVRLGQTAFARAYGVGWARHLSYRNNPLEVEAFGFEAECRPGLATAVTARSTGD